MAIGVSLLALAALLLGGYVYFRFFRQTALWFRRRSAEAVFGGDHATDEPMRRGIRFGVPAGIAVVILALVVALVAGGGS